MDEVLQCPVCMEQYDSTLRRPMMLPACGHTFCKKCINKGRWQTCPFDRSSIQDLDSLPTNILALRSLDERGPEIPGVSNDVRVIRSEDVEVLQKVGGGGGGDVWRAMYQNKVVAVKIFTSIKLSQQRSPSTTYNSSPASSMRSIQGTSSHPPYNNSNSSSSSSGSGSGSGSAGGTHPFFRGFLKEVEVLQLVSRESDYCCRLLGVTIKDDQPCILMKWYGNGHLQVPPAGYDLGEALGWGLAIAKALADVHALGIVVADLKPENVLINDQGDPVLSDFGISKRVQTASTTGTQSVKGTPYYMSPEQWNPEVTRLTNRSDIWSWGCLMLELLTGQPPWLAEQYNMFQVMKAVASDKATPKLPSNLPEGLSNLLACCFKHEPAKRPSAKQLVYELKDFSTIWVAQRLEASSQPITPHHLSRSSQDIIWPPRSQNTSGSASGSEHFSSGSSRGSTQGSTHLHATQQLYQTDQAMERLRQKFNIELNSS